MQFHCAHCGAPVCSTPSIPTARCARCGAVHLNDGTVISPKMRPIPFEGDDWRASPWMDAKHRPFVPGYYECEFRDGPRLRLWWTGGDFCVSNRDLRIVSCARLLKWRGEWAK